MYPVSPYYIEALRDPVHITHMNGTIGNKSFTEADFLSLTISKQCSDNNSIKIGSVYMAELHITFVNDLGISWQNAKGLEITLTEALEVRGFVDQESVLGGKYYIAQVDYTKDGIEVTAYDAMSKLDKNIRAGAVSFKNRTLPAMLEDICEECGVELGNVDFDGYPNHTGIFTISDDNDCDTYRDVVSCIAQTMCSFVTMTVAGALMLRMWKDSGVEDDIIDATNRSEDYSFASYQTYYTGLSAVDSTRQKTRYYHVDPDIGLTYNLGTNPFLQKLDQNRFDAACENILNGLQNIYYTPFRIEILPTLVYQMGDILSFTGGQGYGDPLGAVMSYDYTYGQSIVLEGLGQDPALASAKSKTDKTISGIIKKTEENKEYLYQFYNSDDITLDSNWQTVFSQRFATVSDGYAIFNAEILAEDPTGSVVEVRYLLDGEEVSRYPIESWIEGNHILSLFYPIQTQGGTTYLWQVQMKANGAVEIPEHDALGTIRGQGLASTSAWNGYIDVADEYTIMATIDDADLLTYTETSVSSATQIPEASSISDSFGLLDSDEDSSIKHYVDVYAFNQDFLNQLTWDDAALHTWDYTEVNYVWGIDIE